MTSRQDFNSDVDNYDKPFPDPIELMLKWLPRPTDDKRPLMALTTIDADGYPSVRYVLLSTYDSRGITFMTDAGSAKCKDLAANPKCGAAVVWPEIFRQLIIEGNAEQMPADEAKAVYEQRSRFLKLLSWTNDGLALKPIEERHKEWDQFAKEHPNLDEPPKEWRGYRIVPKRIVFWRGDAKGPSVRHEYTRDGNGWKVDVVAG